MTKFFETRKEQSKIKTEIVTKYFDAWSKILSKRSNTLNYVDLFSGPGRYEDGSESTPLIILKKIISNAELRSKVASVFNDGNKEVALQLLQEINEIEDIDTLQFKPAVVNSEIGSDIVKLFRKKRLAPTLAFIDPFGYKGLTSELVGSLIKDWGSDCIFFFNYNRINMGIRNNIVVKHMNAIFGEERAEYLRDKVGDLTPDERELIIVNELASSLSNNGVNYVLPFRFVDEKKDKTSHYLIFVSKHVLGYSIMKEIMWKCSSTYEDNVASFSYIPIKHLPKKSYEQLDLLLPYSQPLDQLGSDLLKEFSGQSLLVSKIVERHQEGKPFVKSNYKEALKRLEENKKISVIPPVEKRRKLKGKPTMGDNVKITFP